MKKMRLSDGVAACMRKRAGGHVFRLVAIVGGGRQAAEVFYRRGAADLIVVFDNMEEIAKLRRRGGNRGDVLFFPLASGETADTLAEDGADTVRQLLLNRGSMQADSGLGQVPGVGRLAAVHLQKQDSFRNFLRNLKGIVIQATAGLCAGIDFVCTGSGAGGTFSGVGLEVARHLIQPLSDVGVGVNLTFQVLDATSFAGLGHRVGMNAAATVATLASYVADKGGKPYDRVTRSLHLTALPPLANDFASRNELVALDEQAWNCTGLQRQLGIETPNRALDGPLGNVVYRQIEFFRQLAPESDVANAVAARYLPELEKAIRDSTPVRELVTEVGSDTVATQLAREAISVLITEQPFIDDDEFLDGVRRAGERLSCEPYATLKTGERFLLTAIEQEFFQPAACLDDAVDRFRLVRTIADRTDAELMAVEAEVSTLRQAIAELEAKLLTTLGRLNRGCWFCRQARLQQKLHESSAQLRSYCDQLMHREAVHAALSEGLEAVGVTERRMALEFEGLRRALECFRPRGHAMPDQSLFATLSLNESWSELQGFATESREMQIWLLGSLVQCVTLEGLMVITNAEQPTVAGVVERLVSDDRAVVCPYPGGTAAPNGGQQYFVLPPVVPALARELETELQRRLPDSQLVHADFCRAGISAVTYRVFRPANLSELFPGSMARDLADARASDLRDLLFTDGTESLFALSDRCPSGL